MRIEPTKYIKKTLKGILRLTITMIIGFSAGLIVGQELIILPTLMMNTPNGAPHEDTHSKEVLSSNGKKINVWYRSKPPTERLGVVLISHGNGNVVQTSEWIQKDFYDLGYSTYAYDYPGTGGSEGWPWQNQVMDFIDSVGTFIEKKESIKANNIIPVGLSFGTGPSTYFAQKHQTKTLVLIAPYTSISNVAADHPIYWPFASLVRLDLPSKDYIKNLNETCIIAAHGGADDTIPVEHTRVLEKTYLGKGSFYKIIHEKAEHNTILNSAWNEIASNLAICLKLTTP
jgi:uncharacterized protein